MIAIVKYNAGNITSVKNAVERLGYECVITDDEKTLQSANRVIFPGVGEAGNAMSNLLEKGLDKVIKNLEQPVLGICLGQQLLCRHSEEGDTPCLGIFDVAVKRFPAGEKVPHMGWNDLRDSKTFLFNQLPPNPDVYFVHSYYCEIIEDTIATCDYILPFSAAMKKRNFFGTQFHPEKSAEVGEQILKNFLTS